MSHNTCALKNLCAHWALFLLLIGVLNIQALPTASKNWQELISTDGKKFSKRNAHATAVFKGSIWVCGGRTAQYVLYNLENSVKEADCWSSIDGSLWKQEQQMLGDYWAQNFDVVQPGKLAPWFHRYGHTMTSLDIDNDGREDVMLLLGGYSSVPSNDQWITEDGTTWVYCGLAPWSPRAWHGAVVFKGKLWLLGGTPLNSEVWRLNSVKKISRKTPLTTSFYVNYTFALDWERMDDAPWAHRVGMGLVSQFYFNTSNDETVLDSKERVEATGGRTEVD
jgi:hypothetical protein